MSHEKDNEQQKQEQETKQQESTQKQEVEAKHEGHVRPDRYEYNQYDNTADQFDKAEGTPGDPELQSSNEKPVVDKKNTIVDAGANAREESNYSTGNPEANSEDEEGKSSDKKEDK